MSVWRSCTQGKENVSLFIPSYRMKRKLYFVCILAMALNFDSLIIYFHIYIYIYIYIVYVLRLLIFGGNRGVGPRAGAAKGQDIHPHNQIIL
jgi:hypothetical protein